MLTSLFVSQLETKYDTRSNLSTKERSPIQQVSLAFEQAESAQPGFLEQFVCEVVTRVAPSSNTSGLSQKLLP